MLSNYLLIAIRNLAKYKVFSFINITGMAISLASFLLISLFVWDELRYDRHHPDGDRTYRIYNSSDREGATTFLPIVPFPYASYMKKDFPEIESTFRMMDNYGDQLFEQDGKKLMEGAGMFAEPNVFDMLTIHVIDGDESTALVKPNTVALSESLAKKYFGEKTALGETIEINGFPREITAVFSDPPTHFHLKIRYLLSFSTTNWAARFESNWQRQQIFTYLKLRPGANAKALKAKFLPFVEKYAYPAIKDAGFTYVPHLQNIKDIHLHSSNFEWEVAQRGDAQGVNILIGTAVMILVIACLNFINLSTARSVKRMKEVGVRKAAGARRGQLVFQFIAESMLFTLVGLILAVGIAELSLPYLNAIIEKDLQVPYEPLFVAASVLFCLCLGGLAGSYPALHLSRFRPAAVLSKKNETAGGSAIFRQSLVVLQFMLSFFLITGSWIVLSQNEMIQSKNLGFDKEQVIVVPLTNPQLRQQEAAKAMYAAHPNVEDVTIGFGLPGDIIAGDGITDPVTKKYYAMSLFCVDFDYIRTMGMKVIEGREFSTDFATDSSEAFIINETAVKTMGFSTQEEAIGKLIDWNRWDNQAIKHGKVIGVVQDFHFKSLREKLTPVVIHIFPSASWKMAARIKPEGIQETIAHFKKTYESLDPDWAFTYNFLDENFDAMYKSEQRLGKLFSIFTYLAIVVACLGLFGLVEYSVNQRTREISIRKVFGAEIPSLLILLTRRYFLLLAIAFVLIVPMSLYFAQEWLNKFEYRIAIEPLLFVKSGMVILLITVVTVSFQSVRAALTNPVKNLRSE